MTKEVSELKKLVNEQQKQLATNTIELDDLRLQLRMEAAKFNVLKIDHEVLQTSYASAVNNVEEKQTLKDRIESLLDEKWNLNMKHRKEIEQHEEEEHVLRRELRDYREWLEERKEEVENLEADRDAKAPLVEIGVLIRKRFMLRENSVSPGTNIVQQGNDAAHKMNGAADAAIFKLGYWTWQRHGAKFEHIYGADLDRYDKLTDKWRQFIFFKEAFEGFGRQDIWEGSLSSKYDRAKELRDWLYIQGDGMKETGRLPRNGKWLLIYFLMSLDGL